MPLRFFVLFLVSVGTLFIASANYDHGLKVGYYNKSCPNVEEIVFKTLLPFVQQDNTVTAPLLRLHFHDCFVRGCEASILLNSTKTNAAEKDAKPNLTLDGFAVIDAVKEALEKECEGIVSCADIVAIVARDAVSLAAALTDSGKMLKHKKLYNVECGRRDGVESHLAEALVNLPSPFENFTELKKNFSNKGLSVKDLVVLSGAHAIGNSHCFSFDPRLYNNSGPDGVDRTLDKNYAFKLRKECKPSNQTVVEMVPGSSTTFDTKYYQLVKEHKGLFNSDAALLDDEETRDYVKSRAKMPKSVFFHDFGESMVNMGRVGVITDKSKGQIRKKCAVVNH